LEKDYIVSDATANQAATLFYAQQFIGMQDTWETWQKTLSAHYTNTFLITSGLKIGYSGLCLTYCQTIRSVLMTSISLSRYRFQASLLAATVLTTDP
jgi:hypothetical protein